MFPTHVQQMTLRIFYLIKGEIILIDDYSSYDYLKQPLEDYLNEIPKVRLLRTSVREGLIRARMIGARQATGC